MWKKGQTIGYCLAWNNAVLNQFKTQYFRSHDNPQWLSVTTISDHWWIVWVIFLQNWKKKIRCLMWQTCWLNPILTFAETMLHLSLKPTKCVAWLECFAYSLLDFHQKWDSLNCRPLVSMLSSMEVLSIWYCNVSYRFFTYPHYMQIWKVHIMFVMRIKIHCGLTTQSKSRSTYSGLSSQTWMHYSHW